MAAVAGIVANIAVRAVALAAFDISDAFMPLESAFPIIPVVVISVVLGMLALAVIIKFTRRSTLVFEVVALTGLLLSMVPLLTVQRSEPGSSTAAIATLVVMHAVAAVIIVVSLLGFSHREMVTGGRR